MSKSNALRQASTRYLLNLSDSNPKCVVVLFDHCLLVTILLIHILAYSEDQSSNHIEDDLGAMKIDSSPIQLPEELFQLQAWETKVVWFVIILEFPRGVMSSLLDSFANM